MRKIWIGLFFVMFDLSLTLGNSLVDFLPDFVGYLLIFVGLDEEYECPSLMGSRTMAVGAAILTGAVWAAGLLGYGMTFPVGELLQILITYRLVVWAEEQAFDQGWDEGQTHRFRTAWYAVAGGLAAYIVLGLFNEGIALVWGLAATAAMIYYLYNYYKLWKSADPTAEE